MTKIFYNMAFLLREKSYVVDLKLAKIPVLYGY